VTAGIGGSAGVGGARYPAAGVGFGVGSPGRGTHSAMGLDNSGIVFSPVRLIARSRAGAGAGAGGMVGDRSVRNGSSSIATSPGAPATPGSARASTSVVAPALPPAPPALGYPRRVTARDPMARDIRTFLWSIGL